MKTEVKIWEILTLIVIAVMVGFFMGITFSPEREIQIVKSEPEVRYVNEGHSETVWFLSGEQIMRLPFCGLNFDNSTGKEINEYYCYDWHTWDDHDGVAIVKLK